MIKLLKKNIKIKNKIFFKSDLGNINIFFIDQIFKIPKNIKLDINNNKIYFESLLGKITLTYINEILFFVKKEKLLRFNGFQITIHKINFLSVIKLFK